MSDDKPKRQREPREPRFTPEEIKAARENRGLSRDQAAAKIGVTARTWMYYEAGSQVPSPPVEVLIDLLIREVI